MSTPVQIDRPVTRPRLRRLQHIRLHLPTLPEAGASLLRTVIVALFLLTFVLQPFLIPSESMEHTLLVGDFLLVNKQIFAPAGKAAQPDPLDHALSRREARRHRRVSSPPAALPRQARGGHSRRPHPHRRRPRHRQRRTLAEPYASFEPAAPTRFRDNFPGNIYTDPNIDPDWWRQLQSLTLHGELVVPAGPILHAGRQPQPQQGFALLGLRTARGHRGPSAGDLLLRSPPIQDRCATSRG